MENDLDYKEIIERSEISCTTTSTYNIFQFDEYINDLLCNLNPLLSGFIKSLLIVISFMTFPTVVLILLSKDPNHEVIDIFDRDNFLPHIVLFRNAALFTCIYILTIYLSILFEHIVNILMFLFKIFSIPISGKVINIFSIINRSVYYLRNSLIALICFFISFYWSKYEFFSPVRSVGNIRTTILFIAALYFFYMFLLKLFFNILSSNMSKNAYKDRILKNNIESFIFERLYFFFKSGDPQKIRFTKFDSGTFLRQTKMNTGTIKERTHFAEKYFKEDISIQQIHEIFPKRYDYVLSLLKKDESGIIHKKIIRRGYMQFTNEYINIAQSIASQNSIYEKLYVLVKAISFFFFIIILMIFLNLDYKVYLASIAPIVAGISWIFKDTIKEMYDCFKFHLIDNNYDVGDRVIIKGEDLRVKSIDLFGTEFLNYNNRIVYYSTTNLFPLKIDNVNRSEQQIEEIVIDISDQTSYSTIIKLRDRIRCQLKMDRINFTGNVFIRNLSVYLNNLIIRIAIEHQANFQNLKDRLKRREKSILIIEEALIELKIAYSNDFISKD